MNPEILHKLKKVLRVVFLVVVGVILLFVAIAVYFLMFPSGGNPARESILSSKGFDMGRFGAGSGGVTIALPDMPPGGASGDVFRYDGGASPEAPTPTIPAAERKLIQNGALSLVVDRVEETITQLGDIAAKLGGRVDSVGLSNGNDAVKKRATVVLRVPAVNFSIGMEQVKKIALKVESENVSTEDITEKFIDMQARLRNLKAEEAQYLEIMQKAVKIDDVLKVAQRLYAAREQIEQLQGQMNYLSRQVDMSVITIDLSSDPDINPANVVWHPSTTVNEAINGLLESFFGFLRVVIFLAIYLLPITILYGSIAILVTWLIWKLLLAIKKRIHIDVKKHEVWYNDTILTGSDNKK